MKNILAIDFTILSNPFLSFFNDIKEFNYGIVRDNDVLNFNIDLNIYKNIVLFLNQFNGKVHFTYRQEDILNFLKNENILYNIDFFDDTDNYNYIVNNRSWISYALDNNLIKDYRWIYGTSSNITNSYYEIDYVDNINFNMLDVEEVFITLSPEYLPNNYHELFYCLVNNNSIYEDATNRLAYKNKEYNYENAYVTLLGTNDYLYGVLGLKASLDAVDSRYPLIVLVSDLVSQETLETLYNYDITYKLISDLKRKEIIECVYNGRQVELGTTINKIYCFTLTEYNKILFLDADCIVTKNIDKVFDIETKSDPFFLGGVGLIKHVDGYSSPSFTIEDGTTYNYCYGTTIFLTKPDNKIFNDLKHAYENCNNIVNVTDSILFTNYFEQFKDIIFPKNSLYHNNTSEKYWFDFNNIEEVFDYVDKFYKEKWRIPEFSYLSTNGNDRDKDVAELYFVEEN